MLRIKKFVRIFSKSSAGLIYLSFFLVQFNIHFNGTPSEISVFTCDYSPANCDGHDYSKQPGGVHKPSAHAAFKLNKRFHPENLFIVPAQLEILVEIMYRTPAPILNDEQPLIFYSINTPSLRGPPLIV